MINPDPFTLPSNLPVMTFQKTIELLTDLKRGLDLPLMTDTKDAIQVALFILTLLERGDLTYEPLP